MNFDAWTKRGTTSFLATVVILSTATGQGLPGLTASSSGLVCAYRKGGTAGAFTGVSLTGTGTLGSWGSGWFKEIDPTLAPGYYEFGVPDAALSSGNYVDFNFQGAAAMAQTPFRILLTALDPQTAALTNGTSDLNAIADALLDRANAIETGLTPRQALRLTAAGDGGLLSGAGTGSIAILGAGVGTTRVTATTDASGNRTAVTLNL